MRIDAKGIMNRIKGEYKVVSVDQFMEANMNKAENDGFLPVDGGMRDTYVFRQRTMVFCR